MRRERLQNDSSTTLNGAIDATQTSVVVTDGSVFPSEGDFRLLVESEIMLCTARSTNTLTVVRGQEGTTGAAHIDTTAVDLILTEDAIEKYVRDNLPWHNQAPALRIYDSSGAIIGESSFTWVNQGTATAADSNGAIVLKAPAATGANARLKVISAPATPYSVIAAFQAFHVAVSSAAGQPRIGILFRESSTGEFILFAARQDTDNHSTLLVTERFNTATSFNVNVNSTNIRTPDDVIWLKIEDDGTNLKFYCSPNGLDWLQVHSEGRTAFMAGGPDQVGFGCNASHSTAAPWMLLQHFSFE